MELILGTGLRLNAIRYPDKEALVFQDKRFTYKELNERVNRVANELVGRGLKKGDKVAALLHNCNEYLEIFIALAKVGIILVPLTYRAVAKDLPYLVNHADAKGLIFGEEFEEIVNEVRGQLSQVKQFIVVGKRKIAWAENYEEILLSGSEKEPDIVVHETDPIWITYTSGTTGKPKGCLVCHRGWTLQIHLVGTEHAIRHDDVFLNTGPLYHLAPYWFCLAFLYLGAKVVIMKDFDALETLELIEKERITKVFMVPTMVNFILNLPDKEKEGRDLRSLGLISIGAAPLLTKTKIDALKYFQSAQLFEFYGALELAWVTSLKPEDQLRKIRCCGQPFTGIEIKILDNEKKEVGVGGVGEIYVRGFNTFKEYYKEPEATKESQIGEWVTAGDIGRMDEEGYLYIVDRKKDMVISGGVNIYPIEIDEVIQKHPKVLEVGVVGVPDEVWGESLKAVVVPKEGEEITEEEIIKFCEGKLAKYKIPRSVEFVSSLPKTPGGKIQKSVIREKYWKDQEVKV